MIKTENFFPMNKPLIYTLLTIVVIVFIFSSCVPAKKYEELQNRRQQCKETNVKLRAENERLHTKNNELTSRSDTKKKTIDKYKTDITRLSEDLAGLQNNYDQLHKTYQILLDKNEKLLEGDRSETQRILKQLQQTQKDLQQREDKLQTAARKLEEKDARLGELESVLKKQDSLVNSIRKRVSDALLGFEEEGLSVEIRKGKVYVSLEERLLFESGQYDVDPHGAKALQELAKVLERNPEINIMVEGHTDDVPLIPTESLKDNWDLSVMRATSIIKILLEKSDIEPHRLIASGRGEHMPLDPENSSEARRKNRRTEIILTPQLDDLFQIIETN